MQYHGWIPERVSEVVSITPYGRSRDVKTPLGIFCYCKLPVDLSVFLQGVIRHELDGKGIYVASPLRRLWSTILTLPQWERQWYKLKQNSKTF